VLAGVRTVAGLVRVQGSNHVLLASPEAVVRFAASMAVSACKEAWCYSETRSREQRACRSCFGHGDRVPQ
jgi:hypothetical protein